MAAVASASPPRWPAPDAARWGLAQRLAAVGADLVIDEAHLPADPVAFAARRAGVRVWVAGPPLVASLRTVSAAARGPPKASAALLARLPSVPWLRAQLRRLEPEDDPRQVPLL
ncbi:MAG: hypothetical protein QM767_22255 [Anaeromyxobacter sp.]